MFRLLTAFCLFLLASSARAGSYSTSFPGYWNDPAAWQNGQIPPLAGGDTIHVRHSLMFVQQLNLTGNTLLYIDTSGSLCGHYQLVIPSGSLLANYGELDADTVSLPGGHLYNYASGTMLVTYFGLVNNGGSWSNLGGTLQVGANFTCGQKSNGVIEYQSITISIAPNPAHAGEAVWLTANNASAEKCRVEMYSVQGEKLETPDCSGGFFIPHLKPGIYLVQVFCGNEFCGCGKLLVD